MGNAVIARAVAGTALLRGEAIQVDLLLDMENSRSGQCASLMALCMARSL